MGIPPYMCGGYNGSINRHKLKMRGRGAKLTLPRRVNSWYERGVPKFRKLHDGDAKER